jgi:phage FluMu gp28-like protein
MNQLIRTTKSSKSLRDAGLTSAELGSFLVTNPAMWLEALTSLNGEPTRLEPYQVRFLNDKSRFRHVNKARQIGLSTVISAEMVQAAATRASYAANVISVNQKEAKSKIDTARNFYHSIDDGLKDSGLKPVLWTDSENEISFHKPPKTSMVISQPSSAAIRGGKKDIYFDEAAHIREFEGLYQAALPAIIRGGGRMTIISTPLGQSGLFYDIASDELSYEDYSRHVVPWWESAAMVREGAIFDAMAEALSLDTDTRVARYGNKDLQALRRGFGNDIISFQTEFECMFVDEAEAYYTYDLVRSAVRDELPAWKVIPSEWHTDNPVSIGVDFAKERDMTVFTVIEHIGPDRDGNIHKFVRFVHSTREPYKDQIEYLDNLAKRVKPSRNTVDNTGVGNALYEFMIASPFYTEGVVFTQQNKEQWATALKRDLQNGVIYYPYIPELVEQIHGIRRTKTESNFYKFAGKKDDYFWSLVLGLYGESRPEARITVL